MTKSHRQRYGFGSFIKKITRPVKKIAKKVWKSPLGKIGIGALLAGAPIGGGGWFGSGSGWGKGIGFLRNRGMLVAVHVRGVHMTSSPSFNSRRSYAVSKAELPELRDTQYF